MVPMAPEPHPLSFITPGSSRQWQGMTLVVPAGGTCPLLGLGHVFTWVPGDGVAAGANRLIKLVV